MLLNPIGLSFVFAKFNSSVDKSKKNQFQLLRLEG